MKREVIAAVAVLSLLFTVPAFAVEGTQPSPVTPPDFEQMKAAHLKRLDNRINSLQEEKACVQAAKNHDDLKACGTKEMRKRGPRIPGGQIPPEMK